jgi:hypothetical protein
MQDSEIVILIVWIVFAIVVAAFLHKCGRSSTAWLLVGSGFALDSFHCGCGDGTVEPKGLCCSHMSVLWGVDKGRSAGLPLLRARLATK